jgi:hypothetical protein
LDPITTIAGVVAAIAPAAWALSRLVKYDGFGGTFLGPNLELGWPRGVQEDDDVTWHWDRPAEGPLLPAVAAVAPSPPVRPSVVSALALEPLPPQRADMREDGEITELGVGAVDVRPVRRLH